VRAAYDDRFLYFAFHCVDPEPGKVRSTISRRDNMFNDDWVGLSLDSVGNGQQSYDLFINPAGVQGDVLTTPSAGENSAPDFVWDSAGQRTPEGYDVEIRVPLTTIRFKSGPDVRMGILFWRRVSRLGMSASWPIVPRREELHRAARRHDAPRSQAPADPGADPIRDVLTAGDARHAQRVRACDLRSPTPGSA
jgi:hypothetical protein